MRAKFMGRAARMERHHRRRKGATAINLVSMMDIFTILVFFLLVNSGEVQVLPSTKDIELPRSISEQRARDSVTVLVGAEEILVQGRAVARVADVMESAEDVIPEIMAALESETRRVLDDGVRTDAANREVTIMGDREIPYSLLKKIMASCTAADYGRLSLAVIQEERTASLAPGAAVGG